MADSLIRRTFADYTLQEKIGEGGFAVVYRAENRRTGACVAVKVMRESIAQDAHKVTCFAQEYKILHSLNYTSIPEALTYGDIDGIPAFAMSLCSGETFFRLRHQNTRFDIVGAWLAMIRVMAKVHEAGIIHNDLKLENMLLGNKGRVTLLDFGNARRQKGRGWLAAFKKKSTELTGTLTYLAPELLSGGTPNKQSDIYSLGISAHILFSGRPPIQIGGGSMSGLQAIPAGTEILIDKTEEAKLFVKTLRSSGIKRIASRVDIPKDLGAIIDACVRLDPEGRPVDAHDLWMRVDNYFKRSNAVPVADISQALLPKKSVGRS